MCLPRRCGFQNGGVKSYRYESPLLLTSYIYISWFIDLYALYKHAKMEVLKRYHVCFKLPHWWVYIMHIEL